MQENVKKHNGVLNALKAALSSKYLGFVSAGILLLSYYTGLDLAAIYYIGILGALILLLLDDVTPVLSVFLFTSVLVSKKHSPSYTVGSSDFYMQPYVIGQVAFVIGILVVAVIARAVITAKQKKFNATPAFYGLLAFAAVLILNGLFSEGYEPKNMLYGALLAFIFLVVFVAVKDNLAISRENFEKISFYFLALSVLLLVELYVAYITVDGIFAEWGFDRSKLMFGWGIYNTMGMLIVISIAPVMYLATAHKLGFLFYIYAIILAASAFATASRQAIIGTIVIFPVTLIIMLIKCKTRKTDLIITGIAAIIAIAFICVFRKQIFGMLHDIFKNTIENGRPNGSGRWDIWHLGLTEFHRAPIFGTGFYVDIPQAAEMVGLPFVPLMYHNTFIQLLAACGLFGLIAYIVHRTQTVISFFKNVTLERTFIAITICALLILNLFDNHLFYIFPTLVYVGLISVLIKSENKK